MPDFQNWGEGSFTSHSIVNDREITPALPGTLAFSASGTAHTNTAPLELTGHLVIMWIVND